MSFMEYWGRLLCSNIHLNESTTVMRISVGSLEIQAEKAFEHGAGSCDGFVVLWVAVQEKNNWPNNNHKVSFPVIEFKAFIESFHNAGTQRKKPESTTPTKKPVEDLFGDIFGDTFGNIFGKKR